MESSGGGGPPGGRRRRRGLGRDRRAERERRQRDAVPHGRRPTGDVAATVVATGALERATTYALAFGQAPTAGATAAGSGTWSVTDVGVAPGDVVTKGQTLATADSSSLKRDLVAARAKLKVAQDQKRLADTQLGDATTTAARRQGRIGVNNAIAQVTDARASVSQLEDQIARATIVAPEDGVVTDVTIAAGADAPQGAAIVVATGPIRAAADFAEGDLAALKVGQATTVAVDAIGATIKGTVAAIAPAASTTSGGSVVTYVVTVDLADPPADARPGMTAKVTVTTDQATGVVSVPASALAARTAPIRSWSWAPTALTQARDVTVGLVTSEAVEIKSGLTPGESVVIGTVASRNQTTNTTNTGFPGCWRWLPGRRWSGTGDPAMSDPVISLQDVHRVYHTGRVDVRALDGLDLTIEHGEFLAVVGPSGSGKSTLMNIVGCLDRPTGGRYLLDGLDVAELDDDGLAALRSRSIGFVFPVAFKLYFVQLVLLRMLFRRSGGSCREEKARSTEFGGGEWRLCALGTLSETLPPKRRKEASAYLS